MSGLSQVTDKNFDEEIINSDIPAMVDFWAEWCEPCKMMEPVIEELARKYQGKIKIVQMNVAENHKTPARFGIRSIPTLMLFKGGEVKQTIIGSYPRSHIDEELRKLL
ncbi:MAG: thioredoxin [Deltaproteobacteria bacterium]|nr:thioredoxin [Deltaproteobacteria bacterium]